MSWVDKVLGGQVAKAVVETYRNMARELIESGKNSGLTSDEVVLLLRMKIEIQRVESKLPVLITDSMLDLIEYEIYNLWTK